MDVFSDISSVQSRIAEIAGTPPPPPVAQENAGRFAGLVQQALGSSSSARPMYGMPGPAYPYDAGGYGAYGASASAPGPAPVAPGEINSLVSANAAAYQIDPALIKAVIANESGFDANATSRTGAQGLMQLEPETAASVGVSNSYDPAQNVAGGTRYLAGLLQRFGGDVRLAVAAYNAGPGAVEKYGGVPPYAETQNYVASVLDSYQRYRVQ